MFYFVFVPGVCSVSLVLSPRSDPNSLCFRPDKRPDTFPDAFCWEIIGCLLSLCVTVNLFPSYPHVVVEFQHIFF